MNEKNSPITIVIVDDVPAYRNALRIALAASYPNCTIFEETDGANVALTCRHTSPDIVITDLKMPVKDGFGVLEELYEISVDYPVMVLTAFATIVALEKVTSSGCLGFVDKSSSMKTIIEGVDAVLEGKPYYSPYVHALIQRHFKNERIGNGA